MIGVTLGAILAGILKAKRKRLVLLFSLTFSCLGILLSSFVLDKKSFLIGYLIKNFGVGITFVTTAKFIEEVVPDNLLGFYFAMIPFIISAGFVVAGFSTDSLPPDDAPPQEILDNKTYQILMCAPIFFGLIAVIALFTWVDLESPYFYLSNGEKNLALKTISRYYITKDPEIVFEELKRTKNKNKTKVSLWDSFKNP